MTSILHRLRALEAPLKLLGLTLLVVISALVAAAAQSNLSTLSTGKDYRLTEQEVSIVKKGSRLELGIGWQKTNPLVFSKANKDSYAGFFDDVLSQWDSYASRISASGRNSVGLSDLPTYRGKLSAFFFSKRADGKKFPDGRPLLRLVYCENSDRDCIRGQVHFYSKEQVMSLRTLVLGAF